MKKRVVELSLDTSAIDTAQVKLTVGGQVFEKVGKSRVLKSQMILPLIEDVLGDNGLHLSDITAITVVLGPGSFTGLRVGCTVSNALGLLLGVPVNGKQDLATPVYS